MKIPKIPDMPYVRGFFVQLRWCVVGAIYAVWPWPEGLLYGLGMTAITDLPLWRFLLGFLVRRSRRFFVRRPPSGQSGC